eukprot:5879318-Prymnesium_polylepis.1
MSCSNVQIRGGKGRSQHDLGVVLRGCPLLELVLACDFEQLAQHFVLCVRHGHVVSGKAGSSLPTGTNRHHLGLLPVAAKEAPGDSCGQEGDPHAGPRDEEETAHLL